MDLAQRLKLIAETASGLRAAGITSLVIDGISVRYAPPYGPLEPPVSAEPAKPEPVVEPEPDVLDDPATYEGGAVPGYELDEEAT